MSLCHNHTVLHALDDFCLFGSNFIVTLKLMLSAHGLFYNVTLSVTLAEHSVAPPGGATGELTAFILFFSVRGLISFQHSCPPH